MIETLPQFTEIFFGDLTVFISVQFMILFIFMYAITGKRRNERHNTLTKDLKISELVLAYSIISASIIQAITATEILADYSLFITLTNLVAAFYLSFFSPWFQNIIAEASLKLSNGIKNTRRV